MAAPPAGRDPDPYLTHRALIDEVTALICRKQRLSGYEREEFVSEVHVHLIEQDRAVLRSFQGRSSLRTYLVTVLTHRYRDWRNSLWGKWRPSAEARRLGDCAVQLETLLVRDRLPFDQAEAVLRSTHGFTGPREALDSIVERLPPRPGRTFVGADVLEDEPSGTAADGSLERRLSREMAGRISAVIDRTLAGLPDQDRVILRLRFVKELSIADIARLLRLDQKPLYRRVTQLLAGLRADLEAAGIDADDIDEVILRGGFDRFRFAEPRPENRAGDVRPFNRAVHTRKAGRGR